MLRFAGYTLIEILIVLFIISIVTSVALLSINFNSTRIVDRFAEDFLAQLSLAEEHALLTPCVIGVFIDKEKIMFKRFDNDSVKTRWLALDGNLASASIIPSDVRLLGSAKQKPPQIIISSGGEASAFTIPLAYQNHPPQLVIGGETGGHLFKQSFKQE